MVEKYKICSQSVRDEKIKQQTFLCLDISQVCHAGQTALWETQESVFSYSLHAPDTKCQIVPVLAASLWTHLTLIQLMVLTLSWSLQDGWMTNTNNKPRSFLQATGQRISCAKIHTCKGLMGNVVTASHRRLRLCDGIDIPPKKVTTEGKTSPLESFLSSNSS